MERESIVLYGSLTHDYLARASFFFLVIKRRTFDLLSFATYGAVHHGLNKESVVLGKSVIQHRKYSKKGEVEWIGPLHLCQQRAVLVRWSDR